MEDISTLRINLWGKKNETYPSRSVRNNRISELLKEVYDKKEKKFSFTIANRSVCENAFLRAIGKTVYKVIYYIYLTLISILYIERIPN